MRTFGREERESAEVDTIGGGGWGGAGGVKCVSEEGDRMEWNGTAIQEMTVFSDIWA